MSDSWIKRTDGSTVWSERSGNVNNPVTWTQTTRPSSPFDGQTGRNTDFKGLEEYVSSTGKWRILSGKWTTATRPTTTNIDAGSQGFNSDTGYGQEIWNGTEWQLI
jgi:hypothetical protein